MVACSTILDFGPRFVPVNVILQQFYGGHSVYNSLREEIFAEFSFHKIKFCETNQNWQTPKLNSAKFGIFSLIFFYLWLKLYI